jgi:hypothetical protein
MLAYNSFYKERNMRNLSCSSLTCLIAGVLLATAAGVLAQTAATQPAEKNAMRIGTYDARAVAIAYAQSDAFNRKISAMRDELKQAEAAKDAKRAAELKSQGQAQQALLHLQGFGNAPVDDILAGIRDQLPGIASAAGVDLIVRDVDYAADGVVKIDVTDALVKPFKPSEKALKTIAELRKHQPIPLIQALQIKD